MKHAHADLIKRLADDTSLVKLVKGLDSLWSRSLNTAKNEIFVFALNQQYILVPAKHVEVALAHLNKTHPIQRRLSSIMGKWQDIPISEMPMFAEQCQYRIKPERKYILITGTPLSAFILAMERGEEYFYRAECGHMQPIPTCAQLAALYPHEELFVAE